MKRAFTKKVSVLKACMVSGFVVLMLSGCLTTKSQGDNLNDNLVPVPLPYTTVDFKDIKIPSELKWDREHSMSISTESFAGGTLKFVGRVEVNSLSDFFVSAMTKDQWKLAGTVKYENIILAFTKPYKTCTITIFEQKYTGRVTVELYITDDIAARKGMGSGPIMEQSFR